MITCCQHGCFVDGSGNARKQYEEILINTILEGILVLQTLWRNPVLCLYPGWTYFRIPVMVSHFLMSAHLKKNHANISFSIGAICAPAGLTLLKSSQVYFISFSRIPLRTFYRKERMESCYIRKEPSWNKQFSSRYIINNVFLHTAVDLHYVSLQGPAVLYIEKL